MGCEEVQGPGGCFAAADADEQPCPCSARCAVVPEPHYAPDSKHLLVLVSGRDSAVTCSFRSGKKKRESGLCNSIIIDVFELRHDTSCIKVLCWLFAFLQLIGCLHCLPIALALHRCFLIRTACALTAAWSEGNEDFAHTHGTCNLVEKKKSYTVME